MSLLLQSHGRGKAAAPHGLWLRPAPSQRPGSGRWRHSHETSHDLAGGELKAWLASVVEQMSTVRTHRVAQLQDTLESRAVRSLTSSDDDVGTEIFPSPDKCRSMSSGDDMTRGAAVGEVTWPLICTCTAILLYSSFAEAATPQRMLATSQRKPSAGDDSHATAHLSGVPSWRGRPDLFSNCFFFSWIWLKSCQRYA